MYQMLAERLPFFGEYEQMIRYGILNEDPESICSLSEKVPPEVERIVFKAMAKGPDQRYQSAAEMVTDLRAERKKLDSGLDAILDKLPGPDDTVNLKRTQRRLYGIVLALSALLLVALVVIGWMAFR